MSTFQFGKSRVPTYKNTVKAVLSKRLKINNISAPSRGDVKPTSDFFALLAFRYF